MNNNVRKIVHLLCINVYLKVVYTQAWITFTRELPDHE